MTVLGYEQSWETRAIQESISPACTECLLYNETVVGTVDAMLRVQGVYNLVWR